MTPEQVRQIIREELANILKIDRYSFDKNIAIFDGKNILLGTGNGNKIGTAITEKLGLYNATPVTQFPTNNGGTFSQIGLFTQNSTDAVYSNSTFGGTSVGTNRYTIGDIVTALKKLGILAQTS